MMTHHHLDDATLLRFASGDLDQAFSAVTSAHVSMCEACQRAVRAAEAVGGELLEHNDGVALSHGLFDDLLKRIDGPEKEIHLDDGAPPAGEPEGDVPLPLRRLIGSSLDAIPWKRVGPGVRKFDVALDPSCGSSLFVLSVGPGMSVPEHGHGGDEMTLILSGSYRDALGHFGPGDVADLDEHVEHQPTVNSDEPCICIVATEAPTRFKGLFSRLLQPLVGI